MRILFCMRNTAYLRGFATPIRLLAERGHEIHVALEDEKFTDQALRVIAHDHPGVTYGPAHSPPRDRRLAFEQAVGAARDYLLYLRPEYDEATALRRRVESRVPGPLLSFFRRFGRGSTVVRLADRLLAMVERVALMNRDVLRTVERQSPDLMLITPLFNWKSTQRYYLRAAKTLGIRTCLCVFSWDNLTSKGLIRDIPDFVTVWNAAQRQEAVELHAVPERRVMVTGAQNYDEWFERSPSTTRSEFCRQVGLREDRPILLYLCSSSFIAPEESSFIRAWLARLRASGHEVLEDVGILIRPHPVNLTHWAGVDLSHEPQTSVWPPLAGLTNAFVSRSDRSKADFYDSMHHAAAAVGVNTSALIESAIVGCPVHTWLAPEFEATQQGTPHFAHLLEVEGGMLHVAESFEEHAAALARAVSDTHGRREPRRRFLEAFVRPHGLDRPAAPVLVQAIEEVGSAPPPPPGPDPWWVSPLDRVLGLLLLVAILRDIDFRHPGEQLRRSARKARKHVLPRAGRLLRAVPLVGPPLLELRRRLSGEKGPSASRFRPSDRDGKVASLDGSSGRVPASAERRELSQQPSAR